MVRKAALIAVVLLSGCGSPTASTSETAQVADANSRNALARIEDLSSRIDELESQIEDLSGEIEKLRVADINSAAFHKTDADWAAKSIDSLFRNDETFRQEVNAIRYSRGQPPLRSSAKN
jgi:outer membrane murein-binding lipoprotein Lpp